MRRQEASARGGKRGGAMWYRVRADLRGRRIQTVSVLFVVALSTLLTGLGLVVFTSVQAPFDTLFSELNGAHLWLYNSAPSPWTAAQLDAITQTPNVTGATEVDEVAAGYMLLGTNKVRANFFSFPAQQPAIGKLLMTQGSMLSPYDPTGVIIDQPFATTQGLHLNDTLTLVTTSGQEQVRVRGIAVDANHNSGDDGKTVHIHVLQTTLDGYFPQAKRVQVIGLRLADPTATQQTFITIYQRLAAQGYVNPGGQNLSWEDWLTFRAAFGSASRLSATLLLAFGFVSLVAAGVIVVNLVMGQVLAQQRDLGILKAVGFTPLQVARTLVVEYALLGAVGGGLGLALIAATAPALLAQLVSSVGVPVPPQYNAGAAVALLVAIVVAVVIAAGLPAWKAGRTRVADAIRPGGATPRGGRARLTGLLLNGRAPIIAALGVRGITARPLRAALVWLVLLLGVMTAVFALGATATIDRYGQDAALIGVFADVFIRPDLYDPQATPQLIASRPEVAYYFASYEHSGMVGNRIGGLDMVFADGDTRRVQASLTSGRWYGASGNEIVVGDQAMQHYQWHLSQSIPVTVVLNTGQEVTVTYTIVGTLFATQRSYEAYAPLSRLTAQAGVTTAEVQPYIGYEVTLRQGVSPNAFAQTMQQVTADRIGVSVYNLNPPAQVTEAVGIMRILGVVLMLIAGVGILNAMLLSTRERYRELGTLKAIGLTPRQMLRSVLDGAVALGALAVVVGIPVGLLVTQQGLQAIVNSLGGLPHFTMGINWVELALLVPATLLVAALGAYLPARWAARVPVGEVLRYE